MMCSAMVTCSWRRHGDAWKCNACSCKAWRQRVKQQKQEQAVLHDLERVPPAVSGTLPPPPARPTVSAPADLPHYQHPKYPCYQHQQLFQHPTALVLQHAIPATSDLPLPQPATSLLAVCPTSLRALLGASAHVLRYIMKRPVVELPTPQHAWDPACLAGPAPSANAWLSDHVPALPTGEEPSVNFNVGLDPDLALDLALAYLD